VRAALGALGLEVGDALLLISPFGGPQTPLGLLAFARPPDARRV